MAIDRNLLEKLLVEEAKRPAAAERILARLVEEQNIALLEMVGKLRDDAKTKNRVQEEIIVGDIYTQVWNLRISSSYWQIVQNHKVNELGGKMFITTEFDPKNNRTVKLLVYPTTAHVPLPSTEDRVREARRRFGSAVDWLEHMTRRALEKKQGEPDHEEALDIKTMRGPVSVFRHLLLAGPLYSAVVHHVCNGIIPDLYDTGTGSCLVRMSSAGGGKPRYARQMEYVLSLLLPEAMKALKSETPAAP